MVVSELNCKILMCHNNKIENTFNISAEHRDPFFIYFVVGVFFFFPAQKPWKGKRAEPHAVSHPSPAHGDASARIKH